MKAITVRKLIAEQLGLDVEKVQPMMDLRRDLGVDSLDHASLVLELELEFDHRITDEESEKINTVQDMIDIVHLKRED